MTRGAASQSRRWSSLGKATACVVLFSCLACALGCQKQAPELPPDGGSAASVRPLASHPANVANATGVAAVVPPIGVDPLPPRAVPPLTARERVGQSIFLDTSLSNPPGTGCASCHDPDRAFSGNNGSATGVARGSRPEHFARRNSPSVMYLKYVPPFHFALEDDDDLAESPFGGLSWSGRADTVAEFVRLPLFDADEMNNRNEADIAGKLRKAPYAADLAREFPGALESPASATKAMGEALQAFLTSETMSPFTSKFDDFLRGKAQLSPLEMKGLQAFENRQKGACNHCHLMYAHASRPDSSLFTTYSYDAVGVPRNRAIAANADPERYDLGLCERTQKKVPSSDAKWCGSFFEAPRRRGLLCDAIDEPRPVVPARGQVRRRARTISGQREHADASLQPARGRSAGHGRCGHRRDRRLPGDADRRALPQPAVTAGRARTARVGQNATLADARRVRPLWGMVVCTSSGLTGTLHRQSSAL